MTENPLTVSELTDQIKKNLESSFFGLSLQGEVSNFKKQSSGHLYFSLKDKEAQVSAVMFYGHASKLKRLPKSGDQVVVKGDISVYPPRGNYQIVVKELSPLGLGELLLKLEELKREIHRRGWFSVEHKKPLPHLPQKIGIITSPTGAAIQDIINVLRRRFSGAHILLNPVKVQGEGAAEEIAKAIRQMNEHELADVIILGRGGGSIEDLWAFNEECVAEAVFNSQIPIVCAVGHETDHTIAEYVADLRAATPSAAAEIVMKEKEQLLKHLLQLEKQLTQHLFYKIERGRQTISGFVRQPAFASPYFIIGNWMQRVDDLRQQIDRASQFDVQKRKTALSAYSRQLSALNPLTKLYVIKQKLGSLQAGIDHAEKQVISARKQKVKAIQGTLAAIDPKKLLRQGYSILFDEKERSVITTVKAIRKHQKVSVLLSDGEVLAEVEAIKEE